MAIVIHGPVVMADGYGKALINLVRGLLAEGVETLVVPTRFVGDDVPPEVVDVMISPRHNRFFDTGVLFATPDMNEFHRMRARRKVVYSMYEFNRIPQHWKVVLKVADLCVVPTHQVRSIWMANTDRPVRVVPLGYDPAVFYPEEYQIEENDILEFICYGTLQARKSPLLAIEAFEQASAAYVPTRAELTVKSVKEMPVHCGQKLENTKIYNEDFTEASLAMFVRNSDVLLYPTRSEGFGMPILEATACGLVTIFPSHVVSGTFIEPTVPLKTYGDEAMVNLLGNQGSHPQVGFMDMLMAITSVIEDFHHSPEMSWEARMRKADWVKKEFSYRAVARKFLDVLESV